MGFLGIPGASFSLKRAVGISKVKQKIARATGIPTTRHGRTLKMGRATSDMFSGKNRGQAAKTMVKMTVVNSLLGSRKSII